MTVASFACAECHTVLKPTKPVPEGRKVKCPKCGHVFVVSGGDKSPSDGIQARRPQPAPALAIAEEEAWEVVDDEPEEEENDVPVAARRRKHADDEDDSEEEVVTPRRRSKSRDEDEEGEDDVVAPRRRMKAATEDVDEDEEEEPEEEERPRKKGRQRFRPKRQKTSTGGTLKWVLITCAASFLIVGGGTAIGVAFYLTKDNNKGTGNEDLLAFVPQGSKLVMRFDVNAVKAMPSTSGTLDQTLRSGFSPKFWANVKQELGVDLGDFCEQVIVAYKPGASTFGDGGDMTLVIKTRASFSQRKLRNAATEPESQKINRKTYFKINEPRYKILYMPCDNIVIFSSMAASHVQFSMIGEDPSKPMLPADYVEVLRAADNHHFSITVLFGDDDRESFKKLGSIVPAGNSKEKSLLDTLMNSKGIGLRSNVNGDQTDLTLAMHCGDAASAKKLAETAKSFYSLAGISGLIPKELASLNKDIAKSINFGSQDRVASLTGKVKTATFDKFIKDSGPDTKDSGPRVIGRLPTMNDLRGN
jgi:hypothetical protein